ncbi:Uncharacterized protein dnm_032340 [Desulfonema magnum]|uniref:Uncharacterized protein n=1 Tax=Desulfonema magnum TaxID=45655 RepID=A0A975BLC4_9BACT|nr:Uncharacterized protein dnm_032340 [Desulfonema magnum]
MSHICLPDVRISQVSDIKHFYQHFQYNELIFSLWRPYSDRRRTPVLCKRWDTSEKTT